MKYVLLELLTLLQLMGDRMRRDIFANLGYSLLRNDRRGTTMASSEGMGVYSGHGRSGGRSGGERRCQTIYSKSWAWALAGKLMG